MFGLLLRRCVIAQPVHALYRVAGAVYRSRLVLSEASGELIYFFARAEHVGSIEYRERALAHDVATSSIGNSTNVPDG